jgi:hypothetical protein
LIEKRQVDLVFLDFDMIGKQLNNISVKIFDVEKVAKIPLVLYALEKPSGAILAQDWQNYNIIGLLLKRNSPPQNIVGIRNVILNNKAFGNIQNRAIRIKTPGKTSKVTLILNNKDNKKFSVNGYIQDLSVTGSAIVLEKPKDKENLQNNHIERITYSLEGKLIICSGKLIRIAQNIVAIAHKPLSDSYKRTLLKFISEKLSVV